MTQSSSLFPIFGGWVVWVHLLTLVVLYPPNIDDPPPDDRLEVAFVDADKPFICPEDGVPPSVSISVNSGYRTQQMGPLIFF